MSDSSGDPSQFPSQPPSFPAPPPPPPPNMAPPSGYTSYDATNQGAYSSFQRVGGVARALSILVIVIMVADIISIPITIAAKSKAQDFIDDAITADDLRPYIGLQLLVAAVAWLCMLAAIVLTMIWMFRMAKNQRALNRQGTWGPGWAIAGWFLPPCGIYVLPYLMFRDLWKSSDPQSAPDWRQNKVAPVVTIWWIVYGLLPLLFIRVNFGRSFNADRTDREQALDFVKDANATVASAVVTVGAAVAYFILVRQLTARHKQTINEA